MPVSELTAVGRLLASQPEGMSLQAALYLDPMVWRAESELLLARCWVYVAHVAELDGGRVLVRRLLGGELLVMKQADGAVTACANVCRHRGSLILTKDATCAGSLRCPYHGWEWGRDGRCVSSRGEPNRAGSPRELRLKMFEVRVIRGLVFVRTRADGFGIDGFADHCDKFFELHGTDLVSVVSQRVFPVRANWKLVVENFRECLHCLTSHPEYCSVYEYPQIFEEDGDPACIRATEAWSDRNPRWSKMAGVHFWEPESVSAVQPYFARRRQIGPGRLSLTADGQPAGALMGRFDEYDGGDTVVHLHPLSTMWAANDYAVLISFLPTAHDQTDVMFTWVVRGGSDRELNADAVARIEWLWSSTMAEDVDLIELTQRGVGSPWYVPGRITAQERSLSWSVRWYTTHMARVVSEALRDGSSGVVRGPA